MTPLVSHAAVLLLALAVMACDDEKTATGAGTGASASAPAASAKPPEPELPWYVGSWKGSYDAKPNPLEMSKKEGALRAWSEDDGGVATGKGTLELSIDEARTVTGTAEGPLGKMKVTGELDEETLRVRLLPEASESGAGGAAPGPEKTLFNAFFTAKKQGEAFAGELKASSGDGLVVRDAKVVLDKQPAEPAKKSKP